MEERQEVRIKAGKVRRAQPRMCAKEVETSPVSLECTEKRTNRSLSDTGQSLD